MNESIEDLAVLRVLRSGFRWEESNEHVREQYRRIVRLEIEERRALEQSGEIDVDRHKFRTDRHRLRARDGA